ncbi:MULTISPECIES: acyl-CoA dehydrogenase family protein [unclassified Microbacterium]|uniref:acyl-CoA dehydrogenase family protein n=1 Tax=unclassified Microbacterium TaxID=2609290 RepID=UPI00214C753A|nr:MULTISPECIES: acyl-CoA dehydrogenase family protein [unclassified Microbacterium]MCR2783271.1 acyl-CoA dehydrogenase family protein [Microbacterium sp. zg.B96]WIM15854.1 acyl-CoA dehydrogenase family protein [Microbacterium sp. zg-B96]
MTDNAIATPTRETSAPESTLTEGARRMRDEVLEFAAEMQRQGLEAEQRTALTDEVNVRLKAIGVWDLGTPFEYGGTASGARDLAEVLQAVGKGDGSAGWLAQAAATNHTLALAYSDEAVKEVFESSADVPGPRLTGASVFARKVGSAVAVPGGWKVKGTWGFGTGCRTATWNMVGADFEKPDGTPGRGLALIPAAACRVVEDWKVTGMAATGSNTLVADEEVFIPDGRFFDLREMPERMNALRDRFTGPTFSWGSEARIVVITLNLASVAVGMAQGALESFIGTAPKRTPFNLPYATIADAPGTQIAVGRSQAAIDVARAAVERVADTVDRMSAEGIDFSPVDATRTHMELVYTIRLCRDAIADIEEALGSSAAILTNQIQRAHRDIRVLASHGAIRFDPLAELTGRDALGRTNHNTAGGLPGLP